MIGSGLLKCKHRMLVEMKYTMLKENLQHLQYFLQQDEKHKLAVNKVKACVCVCSRRIRIIEIGLASDECGAFSRSGMIRRG